MQKYTEIKTFRFSKQQIGTMKVLEKFNVDISNFVRDAIAEKIKRDWKQIKEEKNKFKLPF